MHRFISMMAAVGDYEARMGVVFLMAENDEAMQNHF